MQPCLTANRQQSELPGYTCWCYLWLSPSGLLLLELCSVLEWLGVPGVELLACEGRAVLVGVECRLFLLSINLKH